jgi:hypothetical protein
LSARNEIAEARATAIVLRKTAKVLRGERGPLMFRLNRAADALDGLVAFTARCLVRIEQLEQQLRQLRAGAP